MGYCDLTCCAISFSHTHTADSRTQHVKHGEKKVAPLLARVGRSTHVRRSCESDALARRVRTSGYALGSGSRDDGDRAPMRSTKSRQPPAGDPEAAAVCSFRAGVAREHQRLWTSGITRVSRPTLARTKSTPPSTTWRDSERPSQSPSSRPTDWTPLASCRTRRPARSNTARSTSWPSAPTAYATCVRPVNGLGDGA